MNSIILKNNRGSQFCNNCGKTGHLFSNCKKPIISSGIISFCKKNNNIYYLMICRKDSLGFVDFLRGKYSLNNVQHISKLIDEMTIREKDMLLKKSFNELWFYLWGTFVGNQYKSEEKVSKEKFNILKDGLNTGETLKSIIENSKTYWTEPEWGFPKGRRNNGENDIKCAMREFMEETGCRRYTFNIIENILPYEEIFTGSNFKSYKHKYYLANIKDTVDLNNFQKSEVSNVKLCDINEVLTLIRPYSLERIKIIKKIDNILKKYSLINFK